MQNHNLVSQATLARWHQRINKQPFKQMKTYRKHLNKLALFAAFIALLMEIIRPTLWYSQHLLPVPNRVLRIHLHHWFIRCSSPYFSDVYLCIFH
jgi:hypothetical protein